MGRLLQCQSRNKATVCVLYRDSSKSQYCMHDRISSHELTIVETLCCSDDVFCNVGVLRFSMNEGDKFFHQLGVVDASKFGWRSKSCG